MCADNLLDKCSIPTCMSGFLNLILVVSKQEFPFRGCSGISFVQFRYNCKEHRYHLPNKTRGDGGTDVHALSPALGY